MSFDLEKGAGASNSSSTSDPNSFPPTYEEHVNDNMRNFQSEFQDVQFNDFDRIEEPRPKQRKRKCPAWVWFLTGTTILLIISALLGGLIIHYTVRHSSPVDKVTSTSASAMQITSATTETKVITQTAHQTRSEETTTIAPLTTTIFVTETPPTTSTQVIITNLTPSTSTQAIVTVISTTTASSAKSSSTATIFSTFVVPVPAITSSSINPSEAALSSSIQAEISRNSAKLIPLPITTTEMSISTTTVISTPTLTTEPTSTTILPTRSGTIFWCGVPGTSCNEKKAAAKRDVESRDARLGGYIGRCGVPGTSCN